MGRSKARRSLIGLQQKYGATVRRRYTKAYLTLKKKRNCPLCASTKFKRKALGIWRCLKCQYTVAGGAYNFVAKKI